MVVALDLQITGLKEIEEVFKQLPQAVNKRIVTKALTKASQPVKEAAKSIVRKDDGGLAESIVVSTRLFRKQKKFGSFKVGDITIYVGPSFPKGSHGILVEFGTKARVQKTTGRSTGTMPSIPFMRPAWDSTKSRVIAAIHKELWESMVKVVRSLRKRAEKGTLSASQTRFFLGG